MYGSQETATAVVKDLRDHGFSEDSIKVVAGAESTDSIVQAGVSPAAAKVYAEGLGNGQALVVVDPLFGYARVATQILDSHDPIAVDVPEDVTSPTTRSARAPAGSTERSAAAPLSAALGMPVLSSDPTPLSTWLGWRVLKPEQTTLTTGDSIRKQSNDPAPLSKKLGLPTLSGKLPSARLLPDAAPLSAKLGWRTLSDDPAPLSAKFGWPTLLNDPAPLSAKAGWKTLSNNPTPLSSWLGLPVLSKR
jgi:hypothetical protein